MKIRIAKKSEISDIIPLWKKLMEHHRNLAKDNKKDFYELLPKSELKWKQWAIREIEKKNAIIFIAIEKKKIIGYSLNIIKKNIPIFKIKKLGHFSDLYIEPEYRSKGIGRKFMTLAMKWFKKKKIKYLSIAAHALNPNAARIYRKFGFIDFHIEMRMKL
ncbi:MAG: GNAT family N-acetyltransferase [Candidatus Micrarchaeota archaeon]